MTDQNAGSFGQWRLVDKAVSKIIDGGNPNSNDFVLYTHPRSEAGGLKLQLAYARLQNRSGSTCAVGIGVRLPLAMWKAGQWVHATTTYTDDTADFQDAGTADAALETTTNDDGFLVSSPILFNALAIAVTTASTGSPVRVIEYSTGTSGWTALTNPLSFAGASANYSGSGAENVIVWAPPADWAPMANGHGTGVTVGHYGLRVRGTTAAGVAGVAATMSVHRIYFPLEGLADNNLYEIPMASAYAPLEVNGDALVAFISTANPQNLVSAVVKCRG